MTLEGRREVVVIGAGWSGLAAAVELAARGLRPLLLEAAPQAGGRARRVEINGLAVDNGQHILLGAYAATLGVLRQVGVDERRAFFRLPLQLRMPPHFRLRLPHLPAPLHLAWGLMRASGLGWRDRLAAARLIQALKKIRWRLAADYSVAELLAAHRQTRTLCRHLWHPLCLAALNTPPGRASAQVFCNVLRDSRGAPRRDATDLLLPRTDLSRIFPDAAQRYIADHGGEVRCGQRVTKLEYADGTFIAVTAKESFSCRQVVLATAPQHAAPLLAALPACAGTAQQIAALDYEPIATCYLQYPEAVHLTFPMLGLEHDAPGRHGQWLFDRGTLGGHPGLLAVVISADGPWQALAPDALATRLHEELQATFGRLPDPLWHRLIVDKRATFACTPGLVRPAAQTPLPGLVLAGDYVACDYPATLEGAVRNGLAAAALCAGPTALP